MLGEIVQIQLDNVAKRLADRQISLQVTPAARELLANKGYDPSYGARPLKRLIQKDVLDELARLVLGGKLHDGETVTVDAQDGKLAFHANLSEAPVVA
jgi:ATP-dependent Clp protease ATP-binding subunit ClpB